MNQKNHHTEEQELSKEAPLLFGKRPSLPKAPDGYFEKLADQVIHKASQDASLPRINANRSRLRLLKITGIAAAIALGLFVLRPESTKTIVKAHAYAEIHEDDIDYIMDIEEDIILDFYTEILEDESDSSIDYLMEEMELEEIISNLDI